MIATIHILCETTPSHGVAVVNGLVAWATFLSAGTAFGSGLPAAAQAFDSTRPDVRSDQINRGLGVGFLGGMGVGFLMFIVFSARIVS